jgi:hypothetical protein
VRSVIVLVTVLAGWPKSCIRMASRSLMFPLALRNFRATDFDGFSFTVAVCAPQHRMSRLLIVRDPSFSVRAVARETVSLGVPVIALVQLRSVRVQRMGRGARIRFRVSERSLVTVWLKRGDKIVRTKKVSAAAGEARATVGKGLRAGRYVSSCARRSSPGTARACAPRD